MMNTNHLEVINSVYDYGMQVLAEGNKHVADSELAEAFLSIGQFVGKAVEAMQSATDADDETAFQTVNLAVINIIHDLRDAAVEGREAILGLAERAAAIVEEINAGGRKHVAH